MNSLASLKARDPSVLTYNLPGISETLEETTEKEENNFLRVYLRIKAGVENYEELYEINKSCTLISKIPEGSYSARNTQDGDLVKKKYDFSKIFGPETSQEDLFNELVKPRLFKFINGENCTLMTYGVSSSGKTYTIVGTGQEPGLLPRSLEYLFKTLPYLGCKPLIKPLPNGGLARLTDQQILREVEIRQNILNFNWPNVDRNEHINTYHTMQSRLSQEPFAVFEEVNDLSLAIWVSYAEIYNEHIYDLLQPEVRLGKSKQKLKLGNSKGHTYVKNLTCVNVSSGLEAFQVLQYGLHHLNYAKTRINDHSSRSHSIFTIQLAQSRKEAEDDFHVSHFNFCDLAGAERSKKTMNVGDRLKESNNINTSLLVLGRCITGVRNAQKASDHRLIPFRESKLTQIFQRALSGHEDICMMVNVNPCRELFDETQHVLNFSAIAKEIVVVPLPRTVAKQPNQFSEFCIQGRSTDVLTQDIDNEICEKEKILQDLRDEISEFITKIEEEEADQFNEQNIMRMEVMTKNANILENITEQFEHEYNSVELALKREYREKLKQFKSNYVESIKENVDSASFSSSESSDEDSEIEGCFPMPNRKRKASVDVETITLYSSDEEEYIHIWKNKVRMQENMIVEHHKTISALREEIVRLKMQNQSRIRELENEVRQQELKLGQHEKSIDCDMSCKKREVRDCVDHSAQYRDERRQSSF